MTDRKASLIPPKSAKRYAWLVMILSSIFLLYKYALQVSPSVMTDELMRAFNLTGAGLGNLAATYFYAYLVMQLLAGPLLDRYSPRILTSLAIATCALGALVFSEAQTLLIAELGRAMIGAGAAFATISYMKMASIWFRPSSFAFVAGMLTIGVMLGAAVGQAPLSILVNTEGWRHSLQELAIAGLILAVLFALLVRSHNPHQLWHHQPANKPQFSFGDIWPMLKNKRNWLLTFYSGFAFAPLAVFGSLWGPSYLETAYQISPHMAAMLTTVVFIGFGLGGPLFGFLSAHIDIHKTMAIGLLTSLIGIVLVVYISHLPIVILILALALFGIGTGGFMLGFVVGRNMNKAVLAASIIGLINTGDAIFGAFSEPLAGKFLDLMWQGQMSDGARLFSVQAYQVAFLMFPTYILLAGVCLWLCYCSRCHNDRA